METRGLCARRCHPLDIWWDNQISSLEAAPLDSWNLGPLVKYNIKRRE